MDDPLRVLLVCPGRGSYGRGQRGSLGEWALLPEIEAARRRSPTLGELDAAPFAPSTHLAGEHASLLTFAATVRDLGALDPRRARVVAVAGNSLGFYTALYAAGALPLRDAGRLVETMGGYQAGAVVGAQVLYPTVGEDWRPDPELRDLVDAALALPGVFPSIHLGGTAVLGASEDALPALLAALPPVERGRAFPLRLPLHSAFHTPLMRPTAERASVDLASLPFASPTVPLVGGDARIWRRHADAAALRDYTLGAQVTQTFDLTASIRAALGDYGPDAVVLPGPGDTLGAPVAQIMIAAGWRGLRDRQDFLEAQVSPHPPVLSMARPEQRARVANA
ncbi:MAG: hypothetical protein AMXMBFR64_47730 [Myxococcales bacterium]